MTSQPQLKFLAIIRLSDKVTLASECLQTGSEQSLQSESRVIVGKLEDITLQPEERQKIKSSNGAWFCTCDDKRIHYLVLADSAYPERHAYGLISEIRGQLKELKDYHLESNLNVQKFSKRYLYPIFERYNDLSTVDNIFATQKKANQIKEVMSDTINKALDNRDTFDTLDRKSEDMTKLAAGFYRDSHALHNKMRSRNRKIMIYGGIALVVFIVIFVVASR